MSTESDETGHISLNHDGYMDEVTQWSHEVAEELAKRNMIVDDKLTEEHWKIIEFVHEFYKENGTGPTVVKIGKATGMRLKEICELFPCGLVRGAYRLAGLPRPPGCI